MKKVQLLAAGLSILISIAIFSTTMAQTGSYSCNVIYGDDINHPLVGVQVDLYNTNNEFIGTTNTGDDGFFTFDNLTIGDSYVAKFTYDEEVTTVDVEDAFMLLMHLYGLEELSEWDLLLANVNGSESVDINDFWTLLVDYYIYDIPFPVGAWYLPDWEFEMSAGKNVGGPSGAGAMGGFSEEPDKSTNSIEIDYDELLDFYKDEIIIPISFNEEISTNGLGIVLTYNEDLIDVLKIESPIENIEYHINNGEIHIAWASIKNTAQFKSNEAILNIYIKENKFLAHGQIERFTISEESHILDKMGKKYPFISFVSSEFKLSTPSNNETYNAIAYPNPCNTYFEININDSQASGATIQIYNSVGQLIINNKVAVNNQKIHINTEELNSGIYIYHINMPNNFIKGSISINN